ncbi:MAG: ornithine carbamoyltransferase [Patescibacteria group bacterium]
MQKDFISITDLSPEELTEILDMGSDQKHGVTSEILRNKHVALVFEKPSLRTKASFETGVRELGGTFSYFSPAESGRLGERESVGDFARTLSQYFEVIVARVYDHAALEKLAASANIPVINALSGKEHPCQVLGDLLTIRECLGRLADFKLAFLGDGNNVAYSLALAANLLGFEFILAGPKKYQLKQGKIQQTEDVAAALQNADVVYTDAWTSMGDESEVQQRETIFQPYQLNADALKQAKPEAIVMHCLPAHRGKEITDDVIDGPQSVVFDQAANRLPVQKAILIKLITHVAANK